MADVQAGGTSEREVWFRGHVLTRFFAAVWWGVVLLTTACVAASYLGLVLAPSLGRLIGAAVTTVIFIPVAREWPNWRRMGRMLRHGT